ncbi:MAG: aspartyl protease family protein [Candidatus Marinimicrobia bacterium]|nr:aspartyl protease family protein [Candidatus Neomarinimicrobiota bacterium]
MLYKLETILIGILIVVTNCSININTKDLNVVPLETDIPMQFTVPDNYHDFWNAIQHFDFDYINRYKVTDEQLNFVCGLELMITGNFDDATELFSTLFLSTDDSLMKENIATVLQALLSYDYKWDKLIELDSQLPAGLDEENTIAFARAFNTMPQERIIFPDKPVALPTKLSISGVPIIEVTVNGKKQKFWIDTGAEMSVLASDIARKCRVSEFRGELVQMGTSTEIVIDSWPGVIEELQIGDITIENHPIIVIDEKNLEFRLFKIFKLIGIDGILGWNAIMNLSMEIDFKNGLTTIKKPEKDFNPEPNFHFVGVPFLSLTDTLGTPFHFFFDTGANKSSLCEPSLLKVDTLHAIQSKSIVGGAGGSQTIKHIKLPRQAFVLGQNCLNFGNIDVHGDGEYYFLFFDGIIGSDIAKSGTLILDFQNGRCELELPDGE